MFSKSEASGVKASVEDFTQCLVKGDFDAWAEYWTEDGVLMPPGHPHIKGRNQILAFVREHFHAVDSMSLTNWRIDGSGDLAVITNDVRWESDAGGGKAKQMMLLAKRADGKWIRKAVLYNSDTPG